MGAVLVFIISAVILYRKGVRPKGGVITSFHWKNIHSLPQKNNTHFTPTSCFKNCFYILFFIYKIYHASKNLTDSFFFRVVIIKFVLLKNILNFETVSSSNSIFTD
jgi:hypothetical protein